MLLAIRTHDEIFCILLNDAICKLLVAFYCSLRPPIGQFAGLVELPACFVCKIRVQLASNWNYGIEGVHLTCVVKRVRKLMTSDRSHRPKGQEFGVIFREIGRL